MRETLGLALAFTGLITWIVLCVGAILWLAINGYWYLFPIPLFILFFGLAYVLGRN